MNREYETDVIRINSQSGKGGISYILEHHFGYDLPDDLRREVGSFIKGVSDVAHKELEPKDILDAFHGEYINIHSPICLEDISWLRKDETTVADVTLKIGEEHFYLSARGNGPLDATSRALRMAHPELSFSFEDYAEHALEVDSDSQAALTSRFRTRMATTIGALAFIAISPSPRCAHSSPPSTGNKVRSVIKEVFIMGMTMTQKILAAKAGLSEVCAGELIRAKLDMVLGNDITSPVAIREFFKEGFTGVFDTAKSPWSWITSPPTRTSRPPSSARNAAPLQAA